MDAASRAGFDDGFLGVDAGLPRLGPAAAAASRRLDYVHFTVLLDAERRLARVTGANVDGARLVELPRSGAWRLDERVPAEAQTGAEVYARNDLDRGHLVRRRDPVWGDAAAAAAAQDDTFRYPNAAPQASGFNQSKELWLGLEDHVLAFADANGLRMSVFTAPVLAPDDPPYRGIRVPLRFWKVAAWRSGDALAAAGFVLDQSPLVDTRRPARAPGAEPELGPFRTFQVPIAEIAGLTGLEMPEFVAADRLGAAAAARGWRPVETPDELVL